MNEQHKVRWTGEAFAHATKGVWNDHRADLRALDSKTKGWDPLEEVKREAAERWCKAVNADGTYGQWHYRVAKKVGNIDDILDEVANGGVANREPVGAG